MHQPDCIYGETILELYIVRHGQSTNNALGADQSKRVKDAPLTELGHRQAQLVAAHLADGTHPELTLSHKAEGSQLAARRGYGITRLYCSAMHRALQTAQPISQALGIAPQVWVDIHEEGGIYNQQVDGRRIGDSGLTRAEIEAQFPGYILPEDVTERGWWNRDYEPIAASQGRAIRVAAQLRRWAWSNGGPDFSGERIAIVSHGSFVDSLLKALLNQLPGDGLWYHHYNTAITHVDFRPNGALELRYLNRTDHLPHDMVSA